MSDAISSISSSSAASVGGNSGSKLSKKTKEKLIELGLDPTKYATEAQAQAAIAAALQAQQPQQAQGAQGDSNSMSTMEDSIKSLASKMGVSVGNNDKVDDILNGISSKITELMASAGTDESKKSEANAFQMEYDILSTEYSQAKAAQNMTGASAMASYNKASLGL